MGKTRKEGGSSAQDGGGEADLRFEYLPAVLMACELGRSFLPITRELPKVLLPINGVPLLEYGLDFLSKNGATQLYILVAPNSEGAMIETFVRNVQTRRRYKSMPIDCVRVSSSVRSVGDALRDLESRIDIRDDFIFMLGDSFSVADLRPAIQAHKERATSKSMQVMTKVFSSALTPTSNLRSVDDDAVIVFDAQTMEVVAYERMNRLSSFRLQFDAVKRNSTGGKLRIHYNLIDPSIDICSPKVLKLLSESFDYMDLRDDFIKSLLEKEIKMEQIFCSILQGGEYNHYAVRINDPRAYFVTCRNVLERWTYPIVPDSYAMPGQTFLGYCGHGVYQARSATTGLRCEIGPSVSLGENSTIGDSCVVKNSLIGKRCTIGRDVHIEGSVIFDGVIVEDGAVVNQSLLSNEVKICSGAKLLAGCILGAGVIIDKDQVVPEYSRLSLCPPRPEDLSDGEDESRDCEKGAVQGTEEGSAGTDAPRHAEPSVTGPGGRGILWRFKNKEAQKVESLGGSVLGKIRLPMPKVTTDDQTDDEMGDSDNSEGSDSSESASSLSSEAGDDAMSGCEGEKGKQVDDQCKAGSLSNGGRASEQLDHFTNEVRALCAEGLDRPEHMHHKVLELKSFRLASNRLDRDVICCCVPLVLERLSTAVPLDKQAWKSYIAAQRIDFLFSSFVEEEEEDDKPAPPPSSDAALCQPPTASYALLDECLLFCLSPVLLDEKTPNPLHGGEGFCLVCEAFCQAELFDIEEKLPPWFDGMQQLLRVSSAAESEHQSVSTATRRALSKKGEEGAILLNTPRLKAFVAWLREDEDEE